jgi:hypothetical protein
MSLQNEMNRWRHICVRTSAEAADYDDSEKAFLKIQLNVTDEQNEKDKVKEKEQQQIKVKEEKPAEKIFDEIMFGYIDKVKSPNINTIVKLLN